MCWASSSICCRATRNGQTGWWRSVCCEFDGVGGESDGNVGNEEVAIDEIIRGTGLTSAAVSATLLGLEMKRLIKQLPGKQYARNPALAS